MKVFVSWSGERSRHVAHALSELLPDAIQEAQVWMSDHSITAGARWANALGEQLDESAFGILCLTKENLAAPWLLFEAGAISKRVGSALVVPYLIDALKPTDVPLPLAQFQSVSADKAGTQKLLEAVNALQGAPMPQARLERVFERWWPDLDQRMVSTTNPPGGSAVARTDRDLLEEVVSTVREMSHALIKKDAFDATAVSNQLDIQIERLDQMEYRYGPDHMQLGKALELLRTAQRAIDGYLRLNAEKSDKGAA